MLEAPVSRDQIEDAPLKAKLENGRKVVKKALREYDSENVVVGFTGGKDSTITAWLVKQVCEEEGFEKPDFMFVDHGQHFDELEEYVERLSSDWGFNVRNVKNEDLINKAEKPGDKVSKEELNDRNQEELERVGDHEEVPWLMDTEAGNHLLKTVPMNQFLEEQGIEAVINGVRWDEHDSRSDEDFFSPRETPRHLRIHPILPLRENEVWQATWQEMVPADTSEDPFYEFPESREDLETSEVSELPICPLYWEGYRSLGSEVSTEKSGDQPAWQQDLENTKERAGRAQNKDEEEIMNKLRELGYM